MVAVEAAVIAEEITRLTIQLNAIRGQYLAEKAQLAGLAADISSIGPVLQQMSSGIQSATQGTNIGSRESKTQLDLAANTIRTAAANLTGL